MPGKPGGSDKAKECHPGHDQEHDDGESSQATHTDMLTYYINCLLTARLLQRAIKPVIDKETGDLLNTSIRISTKKAYNAWFSKLTK